MQSCTGNHRNFIGIDAKQMEAKDGRRERLSYKFSVCHVLAPRKFLFCHMIFRIYSGLPEPQVCGCITTTPPGARAIFYIVTCYITLLKLKVGA